MTECPFCDVPTTDVMCSSDLMLARVNEGAAAGRSVDHVHIHLIPRHAGDVPDPRGGIRRAAPNCNPDEWPTPDTTEETP